MACRRELLPKRQRNLLVAGLFLVATTTQCWFLSASFVVHVDKILDLDHVTTQKPTYWPDSLIHDQTIDWDPTVYRPWLDPNLKRSNKTHPPAMLLLTSFGWNHPDQKKVGLRSDRDIAGREMVTAIVNHPWFHPTLWDKVATATRKCAKEAAKKERQKHRMQFLRLTPLSGLTSKVQTKNQSRTSSLKSRLNLLRQSSSSSSNSIRTTMFSRKSPPSLLQQELERQNGTITRRRRGRRGPSVVKKVGLHTTSICPELVKFKLGLRTDVRYYVFLDVHQNHEPLYPIYGGYALNDDTKHGRRNKNTETHLTPDRYHKQLVFESLLFRIPNVTATVVLFNRRMHARDRPSNRINGTTANLPMAVVTGSSLIRDVDETRDQGLIPNPPKPSELTPAQVRDIETCEAETKRSLFVVYAGNYRNGLNKAFNKRHHGGARRAYQVLHDNKRVFVARYYDEEFNKTRLANQTFQETLQDTVWALAPRGDNKRSLRFTEALSAGAIPVVHADDYVWPFRPELVNWTECAVQMPEKDAGLKTLALLKQISVEQRCRMRQACYRIYKEYCETPEKVVKGIVDGLEKVATGPVLPLQGVRCDSFDDPSECNLL